MRRFAVLISLACCAAFAAAISLGTAAASPPDNDIQILGCGGFLGSDDGFEDNDTLQTATHRGLPPDSMTGLMSCADDDDWYSFTLAPKTHIVIDAAFTDANGDIDMVLYNGQEAQVDSSTSTGDGEHIDYTVPPAPIVANTDTSGFPGAETFYLRVYTYSPVLFYKGNEYDLTVSGCTEDNFENNDATGTARGVGLNLSAFARSCPSDDDWYAFYLSAKTQVDVDVLFTHANGDIDIDLYNPVGTNVRASHGVANDEHITYLAPTSGTYKLQVHLYAGTPAGGNDYDLHITGCAEDSYENNDATGAASALGLPFDESSLQSCPNDDDWYAFAVPQSGKTIQVDALFDHAGGDVDISLYNPAAVEVASSVSTDDDEHITYVAASSGTYKVMVHLFAGTPVRGNDYRLRINVAQPTPTGAPTATPTATPTRTPTPTNTGVPPATATMTPTGSPKAIGDVNDDGQVNAIDAQLILQYSASIIGSLVNLPSADVNEDGTVNAIDATLILQFVAGLIHQLPP